MTTTNYADLTTETCERASRVTTIGRLPHELQPGTVVFDPALPFTGLGVVDTVDHKGLTVEITFWMCTTDDDAPTANNDETVVTWHSTLPIGVIAEITVTESRGCFVGHLARTTGVPRWHVTTTECAELIDALEGLI